MKACYKDGRVVLILKGKFSGSKAIILTKNAQSDDKGLKTLLVAGIHKYPKNNARRISVNKNEKACRMKIFVKKINTNHILPTRFFIDLTKTSTNVMNEKIMDYTEFLQKNSNNRKKIRKEKVILTLFMRNILLDQFFSGKQKWFFKKLRF